MSLAILYQNFTDQLMGALCNMLIHSLWQGLILAAVAGLIVVCTKKASPTLRYNLLVGALLLFVTGSVITFVTQFNLAGKQVGGAQVTQLNNQPAPGNAQVIPVVNIAPVKTELTTITATIYHYINTYHNTIVLIWFLIICAKGIQFAVGIQGVYLLKRNKVFAVDNDWEGRVKQLAARVGITQTVVLLESGLAKVPMVIGHLKPVILIPIGLLTALSMEEVDAILVHELAHIRRRDYLVNLLQSLAEILFFFNPAVLWISQLIKAERENCCDDMALAETNSKVGYIRALVSCEEYQQAVPTYAMAFPGGKSSLMDRVKRMMSSRNHSLNMFEKGLLTICLVISGLCLSAFAEKENIKRRCMP
jgi:bla regulator protein BlaR1